MNLVNWKASDREYLRKFYTEGSPINWDDIEQGVTPLGKFISNWIEKSPVPGKHPLLLPSILANEKSVWIAMAFSYSQSEELREYLNAYIGASGCNYNGLKHISNEDDPLGKIIEEWTRGSGFYQFHSDKHAKDVTRRLGTLQKILKRQPASRGCLERTAESILSDFQKALVNNNENLAYTYIAELREGGRLSSENLLFLKIELYARFEKWNEMKLDPQWSRLLQSRRPRRVTSHMIKSIWYTKLVEYAKDGDSGKMIEQMRSSVLPDDGALFRSYPDFQSPESKLTFIAANVSIFPQRGAQAREIADTLPLGSEYRKIADSLLITVEDSTALRPSFPKDNDPFSGAREALVNEDFDLAWEILLDMDSGVERCKLLMDCSREKNISQIANTVSEAFLALNDSDQKQVLKTRGRRVCWQEIQDYLTEDIAPNDWESWLSILDSHPDFKLVSNWVNDAVEAWDLQMYKSDVNRVKKLANDFEISLGGVRCDYLQLALPDIINYFQPEGEAFIIFKPIYSKMLFFFGVSESMGPSDWSIAESLLISLLSVGVTEEEYIECLESISEIWKNSGDIKYLYWALDLLDLLIPSPIKDQDAFDLFFTTIKQSFHFHARRINADDRSYFKLLCSDLGRSEEYNAIPFPQYDADSDSEAQDPTLSHLFSGKDIGILTLQEGPALRVKALLEQKCENVRIRISHDYGGSEKLKSIALQCDYAVVVTQACKHQAYYFLRDNRPANKNELILPPGRGANSIIGALKDQALKDLL